LTVGTAASTCAMIRSPPGVAQQVCAGFGARACR
jgi:hypothetical protein